MLFFSFVTYFDLLAYWPEIRIPIRYLITPVRLKPSPLPRKPSPDWSRYPRSCQFCLGWPITSCLSFPSYLFPRVNLSCAAKR